jgi:hypothetical protein
MREKQFFICLYKNNDVGNVFYYFGIYQIVNDIQHTISLFS